VRWGTDGINPTTGATATYDAIVVSCTPADEIETLYVENGNGLKTVRIILWQGRRVNITIVDDSNVVPPTPGVQFTMFDPLSVSGVGPINSPLTFRVLENSYNATRKEAGQRVITAEYLTMIEGSGTPPPN